MKRALEKQKEGSAAESNYINVAFKLTAANNRMPECRLSDSLFVYIQGPKQ